ncbi:MAG TPA: hypothetical protein VJR29_05750 [bacterium]|nr:hypothetical protein [bacterium]
MNSGFQVARLLDHLAAVDGETGSTSLQSVLSSGRARNLAAALEHLSPDARRRLEERVPTAARAELLALAGESDAELFGEGLFHWASRQEAADRLDSAALVYELLRHRGEDGAALLEGIPDGLRARAAARLDAIEGKGPAGARVEFLARRFVREASNPVTLVGMAAGSFAFTSVRSALLARTLASGRTVLGARALASSGAFLTEVPVFWGTTKGLNEILHPGVQAWDARSNLRELAGLGLTLGALKLSGALSGGALRWAHQPNALGQATRLSGLGSIGQRLVPQVGMLGGIMAGHRLEEMAGLRPHVDGATTLTDSLILLMQFNVGGNLSRRMMGERFHAYTESLERRSRMMESDVFANQRARLRAGWENLFPGSGSGLVEAVAGAGAVAPRRSRPAQAPDFVMMMNGNPEGPGSGRPGELSESGIATPRVSEGPPLPRRTNVNRNGNGVIVDRMEPELKPQKLLGLLSEQVQSEILQPISLQPSQIGRANEMHLGDGLAMALSTRIQDVLFEAGTFERGAPFDSLPENYRQALRSADELVGVVEYLRRSENQAAFQAFEAAMDPELFAHYENLKSRLSEHLGPTFEAPQGRIAVGQEVVQPDKAILSIGSGDMMGMLALYRHNIRPGGLSWRTRLFATARDPAQAAEINNRGTNRAKINLRQIQLNYLYDPPIEAVGPGGYRGLTQEALQRTVRLQLLNVPSDQLHKILTPEYLRSLPENAILLEVIGGFIAHENLGLYREGLEEGRSLLPYQLIRRALEANSRTDVSIVSGGGFIPGKRLWNGEQVRMVFAGPEGAVPRSSPAAELVARVFAGPSGSSDFLEASVSHHQHSTELGKAMKNVTSLLAGFQAAEAVAAQMESGAVDVRALQGRYETEIRNPLFYGVMRSLLRENDTEIRTRDPDYRLEVADDYWRCTQISIEEIQRLLRDAREVDVMDRQALRDFVLNRVVNNTKIASTRNPKRGMVQSLYNQWRLRGTPFELRQLLPMEEDGVTPKMTEEGVNSLLPMTQYYNHSGQPVERRRLPAELYRGYSAFNPNSPLVLPPRVPDTVRRALQGDFAGIDAGRLRRALAQRSETAMNRLDQQLRILDRFRRAGDRSSEQAAREYELTLRLIAAMKEGEPLRVARSPIIRPPYGNMFVIRMAGDSESPNVYRAYIRVDGQRVMDRITQLGAFLRSFPEGSRLLTEVNVEGLDPLEHARERAELEMTLRSILDSYQRVRPNDRLALMLGDTRIIAERREREGPNRAYFDELGPLVERLRRSLPPGQHVSPQSVRNTGQAHGGLIENFLQSNPGWPMLLGYFGGPVSQGIKSALTRPERGTLIGIYSGGQMIDSFSVFRGRDNRPMVLNHGLMSRLKSLYPDEPAYQGINSIHFYEGMRLDPFLRDYERYAASTGHADLNYRLINLRSMPLEEALTGRVEGVNPALLRLYLEGDSPNSSREAMFQELAPLYERPFGEVEAETAAILQRRLEPFYQEHAAWIDQFPLFKLFQRRRNALAFLMRNGESSDHE